MKNINRRRFLKTSILTAGSFGLVPQLAVRKAGVQTSVNARVRGANEDIRVAMVGFNGRGKDHIKELSELKGVRLLAPLRCRFQDPRVGRPKLQGQTTSRHRLRRHPQFSWGTRTLTPSALPRPTIGIPSIFALLHETYLASGLPSA